MSWTQDTLHEMPTINIFNDSFVSPEIIGAAKHTILPMGGLFNDCYGNICFSGKRFFNVQYGQKNQIGNTALWILDISRSKGTH